MNLRIGRAVKIVEFKVGKVRSVLGARGGQVNEWT
jgi:hypothetical protein